MLPDYLRVVRRLTQTFDALHIAYLIGGSVASSVHGIYRFTNDVDFVVDLKEDAIAPLVAELEGEFYIDAAMIQEAIQTASSFSVLHLPTMVKADCFLRPPGAWKEEEWARRRVEQFGSGEEVFAAALAGPEDMILQKLAWYRLGRGVSDRQWGDVTGMLKVQANTLDYAYLRRWAADQNLTELLQKAYADAGIADVSA